MRPILTKAVRRKLAAEDGTASVEMALFAPIFLGAFLAVAALWDGFAARTDSLRATYAVADALSRTYDAISPAEIHELEELYAFVARAQADENVALRVSVVSRGLENNGVTEKFDLEWSYSTDAQLMPHQSMADLTVKVPEMRVGEQVIVTETFNKWTPVRTGETAKSGLAIVHFDDWEFQEAVMMRPRFIGQVFLDTP